jgi:hypothetical protein
MLIMYPKIGVDKDWKDKERVDQEASAALGEIVAISEELGLYD